MVNNNYPHLHQPVNFAVNGPHEMAGCHFYHSACDVARYTTCRLNYSEIATTSPSSLPSSQINYVGYLVCACLCVRAPKENRLKLSTPKSVCSEWQMMQNAPRTRLEDWKSRSRSHDNEVYVLAARLLRVSVAVVDNLILASKLLMMNEFTCTFQHTHTHTHSCCCCC